MNRTADDFGITCFCKEGGPSFKEGGAPHESGTGTCRHVTEGRPGATTEAAAEPEEALGCSICETETDEDAEECLDCGVAFHSACEENHVCGQGE